MKKAALLIGVASLLSAQNTSSTLFTGGGTTRGKKQLMKPSVKGWRTSPPSEYFGIRSNAVMATLPNGNIKMMKVKNAIKKGADFNI